MINVIICGFKAQAAEVFDRILGEEPFNLVAIFSDEIETFGLLNRESIWNKAKKSDAEVFPSDAFSVETLKSISSKVGQIDVVLLTEWKSLIPKSLYQFPKLGTYNIHDSLLPSYRGSSPLNWAIINGEKLPG